MPRKGKGSKRKKRNTNRDAAVAQFWTERLRAARKDPSRKRYIDEGNRVVAAFKAHHEESFEPAAIKEHFLNLEGGAAISIPKAAQARNSLGPHLYPDNPIRTVTARAADPVMIAQARVLDAYINYTPREAGLKKFLRKGINDSALRGRGFGYTGWNDVKEIVTSWSIRSIDVLIDPDAEDFAEAEWIAIRHRKPIWRVKRDVEDWRAKGLKANLRSASEPEETQEAKPGGPSNDLVEYYVIYSRMGAGPMKGAGSDEYSRHEDSVDYKRFEIVEDHHSPLAEDSWENPLYLDEDWPLAELDLIEPVEEQWPVSLMGQVDSLCRTVDLLGSAWINGLKERLRVLIAADQSVDPDVQRRVKSGGMLEFLSIKLTAGKSLKDCFQEIAHGATPADLPIALDWLERQIEATTGVSPSLHGAQTDDSVDRSATASRNRAEASNARVGDMRGRVEEWQSVMARHEAIMVRLTLEAEEVARYVPPDAIGFFFIEVLVAGGATLPLRGYRDEEEGEPDQERRALTMIDLDPGKSTYYESPEDAAQAAIDLWGALQTDPDPRIQELVYGLGQESKENGLPEGISVAPVSVEDVWRDTDPMTPDEMMREFSYSIEAGSFPKMDKDREMDRMQDDMQQILPIAQGAGDVNLMNAVLQRRDDVLETPPDQRLPPVTPPPPEPAPGAPQ